MMLLLFRLITFFTLFFCAVVLGPLCGCRRSEENNDPVEVERVFSLSVCEQLALQDKTALPLVYGHDLVIAADSGEVRRVDHTLATLWKVKYEGADFSSSGAVINDRLLLASRDGSVFCLNLESGSLIWKKELDAVFVHVPLSGNIGGSAVMWMLSQSDGVLYALKVDSGELLWSGEETNRSDGNAVLWENKLAYGNCDGAIHLFNASDGSRFESIAVGASDQMAGTPLVSDDGLLWIGTLAGSLAVIDLKTTKLISKIKVSEDEAFVRPVPAFSNLVAMGVSAGDLYLCGADKGKSAVESSSHLEGAVDSLFYDGIMLYVLSEGNLIALNSALEIKASINLGDKVDGAVSIKKGLIAVVADNSLLLVKGEWK